MTIYSQRDIKWKDEKMGSGTIGQYGCLITCISMLRDVDPKQTNKDIKSVDGYSGNFVIWEALDKISGLDFVKRVKVYENDEVAKNLPCLVEVNGAPIGGTTHWVLYVGNQKMIDPWDGKEKPTSSYKPIGYAVIKRLEVPNVPQPPQTALKIDLTGFTTPLETYGVIEIDTLKSKLLAKDGALVDKQGKIEEQKREIDGLNFDFVEIISERDTANTKLRTLKEIKDSKNWWFVKYAKIMELLG